MRILRLLVPVGLALAVVLTSCGDSDGSSRSSGEQAPQYSFNVDRELLGNEYADRALGLRLFPPEGWAEAPPELREQVRSQVAEGTELSAAEVGLRTLFVERSSGSALVVYEPIESDNPADVFEQWTVPEDETAEFRHNGLRFFQARMVTEKQVRFTLAVEARDGMVTVLQYFMPQAHFKQVGRSIESSIGSIEPLDGG
jgi:hypothetical protein